ncbi:hypothetical protein ACWCQP_37295 [Streptomyces chartreusis]
MTHTFDDLVEMQKAADEAHAHVLALRGDFGRPTESPWSSEQNETYEKAWQSWRRLASTVQAAVTAHAKESGEPRFNIEAAVRTAARHPETESTAA